jgi:hypothetical protein
VGVAKVTIPFDGSDKNTRKKVRRRPKLTGRDERILALLGEYGCVAGDRIKSYFWNSTPASCAHYRRLGILRQRGLIENVLGDRSIAIGYRLTKRGEEALTKLKATKPGLLNRRAYKTQFEHDQLLIDVRRILEKSPLISDFRAEPEIRRDLLNGKAKLLHWENAPMIPDATFAFSTPGQKMRMAAELELTLKTRRRYTKIFRNHLLSKNWQMVIYVVKGEDLHDRLMKLLNEVKTTDLEVTLAKSINGIYFCALEEFLKKGLSVPMTNGKKEISFEQIAQSAGIKS